MTEPNSTATFVPDSTAIRVALWRALHTQLDARPYLLEDTIGLQLANLDEGWQERPDMHPEHTRGYRASIVGRSRFVEDFVLKQYAQGIHQYVILGSGLDSFAQRRPESTADLKIFEIDKPETQQWKQQRLRELHFPIQSLPKFVPVDFEAGECWDEKLITAGFNASKPAVIASTGVAMYLTKEANFATLQKAASFARGSTLLMTFLLPTHLVEASEQDQFKNVQERARAAGTPILSLYTPSEILLAAQQAGFNQVSHFSRAELIERYFKNRSDGLLPASGEEFLLATC